MKKIQKTKIFSVILVIVSLLGVTSIGASAMTRCEAKTSISCSSKSETKAVTSQSGFTIMSGYCSTSAGRCPADSTWFITKYKSGSGWNKDVSCRVYTGTYCPTTRSTTRSTSTKWKLVLNAYGLGTATANGTLAFWI